MTDTAQAMRDHWWWRPGRRVGRSFYTWHVTFDDQPAAHRLAADSAHALEGLSTLDPVPVRWLHLTMQGIGFTDTVERADVEAIVHVIDASRAGWCTVCWKASQPPAEAPARWARFRSSAASVSSSQPAWSAPLRIGTVCTLPRSAGDHDPDRQQGARPKDRHRHPYDTGRGL